MPSPLNFGNNRWCVGCQGLKDKTEFKQHANKGYSENCKACLKRIEAGQHENNLKKASKEILKGFAEALTSKKIEVPHTSELAAAIVGLHGGVGGVADFIYTQGKTAADERPGSRLSLEYCKMLTGLVVKSTEQRQTAPDVANLPDEEIERQIEQHMRMLIESHPDVVSRVLETSHRRIDVDEGQEEPAGESESV